MINLNPTTVKMLFADLNDQADVFIALYRMIFPNWDQITKLKGYPSVSNHTSEEIYKLFISFDYIHHPKIFAGGLWMNRGFMIDDTLPDWTVSLATCEVSTDRTEINQTIAEIYNLIER